MTTKTLERPDATVWDVTGDAVRDGLGGQKQLTEAAGKMTRKMRARILTTVRTRPTEAADEEAAIVVAELEVRLDLTKMNSHHFGVGCAGASVILRTFLTTGELAPTRGTLECYRWAPGSEP